MNLSRPLLIAHLLVALGCGTGPAEEPKAGTISEPKLSPAPAGLAVGDWPQFLGPEANGISRETGLRKTWPADGPPVLWKLTQGATYAAPSIVGTNLINFHRLGDEEVVECLDAETGKSRWRFAYPTAYVDKYGYGGGPRAAPTIVGDRVFTLGAEGKLHCLKLADGSKVWGRDINADYKVEQNFFGVGGAPVVDSGKILINVGGAGATCAAFDVGTGKTLWTAVPEFAFPAGWPEHLGDGASYCAATVGTVKGKRVVFFLTRAGAVACDVADGKILGAQFFRSRSFESVNAATPLIVGDNVFFTATYQTGCVMLSADGLKEVWASRDSRTVDTVMGIHWSTPLAVGGHIYGFNGRHQEEATLRCVDAATGKLKWSHPGANDPDRRLKSLGRGSMILADGRFYLMAEDGHLVMAEIGPEGYRELGRLDDILSPPAWTAPVLSRGRLYVRNEKTLIAYDLRQPKNSAVGPVRPN